MPNGLSVTHARSQGLASILAVDIGGTNICCGVVETRRKKAPDLSKASVWKPELWCHADEGPSREAAVKRCRGAVNLASALPCERLRFVLALRRRVL